MNHVIYIFVATTGLVREVIISSVTATEQDLECKAPDCQMMLIIRPASFLLLFSSRGLVFTVEDLDVDRLNVRSLLKDPPVGNAAVERVAEGPLVGIVAAVGATVGVVAVDLGLINVFVRGHGYHQAKLHAVIFTLGQEHPLGDAARTAELLQVQIIAAGHSLVGLLLEGSEADGVWHGDRGLCRLADDCIAAGAHWKGNVQVRAVLK